MLNWYDDYLKYISTETKRGGEVNTASEELKDNAIQELMVQLCQARAEILVLKEQLRQEKTNSTTGLSNIYPNTL
jgi:predicted transcriptional regulator